MGKLQKLGLLCMFLSTTAALSISVFMYLSEPEATKGIVTAEKFGKVVETQHNQKQAIEEIQKNVQKSLTTHGESMKGFESRIAEMEKTQQKFLDIMVEGEGKQTPAAPAPTPTPAPTPAPAPSPAPVPAAQTGPTVLTVTDKQGINLRKEATNKAASLGIAPYSSKLTVIGGPKSADGLEWYQVKTPQGNVGWVAKKFTQ